MQTKGSQQLPNSKKQTNNGILSKPKQNETQKKLRHAGKLRNISHHIIKLAIFEITRDKPKKCKTRK
uniref:Uncharacterized protein n=1 Tax=Solanum tuberosum TaxID=4113 RepID=M1B3T2_SOLTU